MPANATDAVNVRVYLAAYLIVLRPTHVFESMGTLERALLDAATPLVGRVERLAVVLRGSAAGGAREAEVDGLLADFQPMLFNYLRRFRAWKVPDEARLSTRIRHALIALYQAQAHLPADEAVNSQLSVELRTQIERLRGKLVQIAGQAALDSFDAERHDAPTPALGDGGEASMLHLSTRLTNEQLAHELLLDPAFQLDETGGVGDESMINQRIRETFHEVWGGRGGGCGCFL